MASTSGRSSHMAVASFGPSASHHYLSIHLHRSRSTARPDSCTSIPLLRHGPARHRTRLVPATPAVCQAQKTKQESERPVMERLESDLIAGIESNGNGVKRNGSKAPSNNSATNVADRTEELPAEKLQDDDENNDPGEQSHSVNGSTIAKAASKVPGGVTEADNLSAPKPASFWLPQPEVMHQVCPWGSRSVGASTVVCLDGRQISILYCFACLMLCCAFCCMTEKTLVLI